MAYQHIAVNVSSPLGHRLRLGLDYLEQGRDILRDVTAAMSTMVDTEPNPDDYTHLEQQFGLEEGKGQVAKGELESLLGKIDTDASVNNVKAAMQQVFNFFA